MGKDPDAIEREIEERRERIGERIRRALRDAGIAHASSLPSGLLTTSLGGAVCRPGPEKSLGHASLVEAADRALYAMKHHGRSSVQNLTRIAACL